MQAEEELIIDVGPDGEDTIVRRQAGDIEQRPVSNGATLTYIVLPAIFLLITLLGGFRIGSADNAFIFERPPLVCLVFSAVLMVLYIRAGFLKVDGWFSHAYSSLQNTANALVLLQITRELTRILTLSLHPERERLQSTQNLMRVPNTQHTTDQFHHAKQRRSIHLVARNYEPTHRVGMTT